MKRIFAILLTASLTVGMLVTAAVPVGAASVESFPLYAGQTILVGQVEVTNDTDNITIEFVLDSPWELIETHVAVADNLDDIPQAKGNPIPGQFQYSGGSTIVIPNIWEVGDDLFIAAHAKVRKVIGVIQQGGTFTDEVVSGAGSDSVLLIAEGNSGFPAGYVGPGPTDQTYAGGTVPSVLAWTHSAWGPYGVAGAQWISSAEFAETPDFNTWRLFTSSFALPSDAFNISGTMTANSDNAEDVYLNNVFVGDGTPAIVYGASPPSGPQHGWSSVESWVANPQAGSNNLWIMTRNYGWPGGPQANPTALVYKLSYQYDIPTIYQYQTETAWGDGTAFPGKNWATYFTYTVQSVQSPLVGQWLLEVNNSVYDHDLFIVSISPTGAIAGNGGYPVSGPPYNPGFDWTVTGQLTGNSISMTIDYTNGYTTTITGTVAPDFNSMSGGAGTGGVFNWTATKIS